MENKDSVNKIIPVIYVLIAGITWGIIGLFVRNLNGYGFSSMGIVFLRSISGSIIMGIFLLLYNRDLFRIRMKDIWCFIGTGIVSLTLFNICYFTTIKMTSLAVAAILLYTAPSMVMVMSAVIFKEKLTMVGIVSVILAFAGCALVTGVVGSENSISAAGIIIGLGSGLGYALYSIFARFALDKGYHSFTVTFYTLIFSSIGTVFFFQPALTAEVLTEDWWVILLIAGFGLISTAIPYIFYTLGLQRMEAGKASVIASVEPVTATVIGLLIYNEHLSAMSVVGVALVLISIAVVNQNKK